MKSPKSHSDDLSPPAQAVLDACEIDFQIAFDDIEAGFANLRRLIAASAFRALAASQGDYIGERLCVPVHNILAIADELESQP
jgi:hypothetical protein